MRMKIIVLIPFYFGLCNCSNSDDLQKFEVTTKNPCEAALEYGSKVLSPDFSLTEKALRRASKLGNAKLVDLLLRCKDFDLAENRCQIIGQAAYDGHLDLVKVLLAYIQEHRDDFAKQIKKAALAAAFEGHTHILKYILETYGLDMEACQLALEEACDFGHLEIVKLLVEEYGVDPTAKDNFALGRAGREGHPEVYKYLLTREGVKLGSNGFAEFYRAIERDYLSTVKLMILDPQVDPSLDNNAALIEAASYYSAVDIVDFLLDDARVIGRLTEEQADYLVRHDCSCRTKLLLLSWLAEKMSTVDMSWIPMYQEACLKQSKLAAHYETVKTEALVRLGEAGFQGIALLIETWSSALKNYSRLLLEDGGAAQAGSLDGFMEKSLPERLGDFSEYY